MDGVDTEQWGVIAAVTAAIIPHYEYLVGQRCGDSVVTAGPERCISDRNVCTELSIVTCKNVMSRYCPSLLAVPKGVF